jgi:hypothetical protein
LQTSTSYIGISPWESLYAQLLAIGLDASSILLLVLFENLLVGIRFLHFLGSSQFKLREFASILGLLLFLDRCKLVRSELARSLVQQVRCLFNELPVSAFLNYSMLVYDVFGINNY